MQPEALGAPDPDIARKVEALAGYGIADADIARVLRIDLLELRRAYREELETGAIKANSRVAENLYRRATGDGREAVTAAIFWLKARARWRDGVAQAVEPPMEREPASPRMLAMAVLALIRAGSAEGVQS